MNRAAALEKLAGPGTWDLVVIGGGATGLGVALDAATRGYRTALLEARDFAQGTSSRSTKLIHGGVRYLRSGNIGLVRRALHERTLLQRNAAGLVTDLGFVIPAYDWHERFYYGTGLKLYDFLARGAAAPSRILGRDEALRLAPTLEARGLRGGVLYHDAQFDDARLALALALTATEAGAAVVNHVPVVSVLKAGGRIAGVGARDAETGREFEVKTRAVVNATGVFGDDLRRLDDDSSLPLLAPSQGAHVVLPERFLPGGHALMIPKTSDGRVLFAIPWLGRVLVGTTDTPVPTAEVEPRSLPEEVTFLLEHIGRYLSPAPTVNDVVSTFAGLRPLVRAASQRATSQLSRDHVIEVSSSGLVTITGGKWTTFREMAEDTVNRAAQVANLPTQPCRTSTLALRQPESPASPSAQNPLLHPQLSLTAADVRRAAREQMARTVEDVLSRRTRCLLFDAAAAAEAAPAVAQLLAAELNWSADGERRAVQDFQALARHYLPSAGIAQPVAS
jgi:glycerol-3-phosphate dehydrogenase